MLLPEKKIFQQFHQTLVEERAALNIIYTYTLLFNSLVSVRIVKEISTLVQQGYINLIKVTLKKPKNIYFK